MKQSCLLFLKFNIKPRVMRLWKVLACLKNFYVIPHYDELARDQEAIHILVIVLHFHQKIFNMTYGRSRLTMCHLSLSCLV